MTVAVVEVRPMERSDLEPVLDAWEQLMAAGHAADPRFATAEDGRAIFREHLLQRVFGMFHPFPPAWVAVDDGRVVGWIQGFPLTDVPVVAQPPTARIFDLWVAPDARRSGVGRRLVTSWVERARAAGHPWIEVGTLARDARAVAFWRSVGFGDWKTVLLRTS